MDGIESIQITLNNKPGAAPNRLVAFGSIVLAGPLGCFQVHDLKIIENAKGIFLAMPDRKIATRCSSCRFSNHLLAKWCNECGIRLPILTIFENPETGRPQLYADIFHPIDAPSRKSLEDAVLGEYRRMIDPTRAAA